MQIRRFFTNYKRGYSQFAVMSSGATLLLSLYTALVISIGGYVSKWLIIGVLIACAGVAVLILSKFGEWDYNNIRSIYRQDCEIEITSHPYRQDSIILDMAVARAVGVDPAILEKWVRK